MLGRSLGDEQGKPNRSAPATSMSEQETELMGQATRCVRKFAPEGRKKMRRTDNGHITACKISDSNPNEMIASWSGDHIYSFDLARSPDATTRDRKRQSSILSANERGNNRPKESRIRKRKRRKENSSTSHEAARRSPRPRPAQGCSDDEGDLALRVRYENGQSEDIAMGDALPSLTPSAIGEARESIMTEAQKRSLQIAKSVVRIRKLLFSLEASAREPSTTSVPDLGRNIPSFTAALGLASTCILEMDETSRSWGYPVNPTTEDIMLQQTLRGNRDSARRFVQAAGTLARLLGGKIQTTSHVPSPAQELFEEISQGPHEASESEQIRHRLRETPDSLHRETFCYDFLRAILLWLEGGSDNLLQGFKRPSKQRRPTARFSLPDDAQLSSLDDILFPYLMGLAGRNRAIPDVDASRFESDETRQVFHSESAAVRAFAQATKIPLDDLSRAILPASGSSEEGTRPLLQDRITALKFWGFKVGRGILLNAGEGVNFQFVDIAFGGLGISSSNTEEGRVQEDINPEEEEDVVDTITLVKRGPEGRAEAGIAASLAEGDNNEGASASGTPERSAQDAESDLDIEDAGSDAEVILMDDLHDEIAEHMAAEDEDEADVDNEASDNDGDDEDEDDGDITAEERSFMFQSASDRGKLREKVEKNVPCYSHTRQYRGHCNVKTVKDANFFGMQDEYVVSGSDGGHLFIWNKKTTELVNILEGDNEVVNVVEGEYWPSISP